MLHIIRAARRPFIAAALATCLVAQPVAAIPTRAYAGELPAQQAASSTVDSAAQMMSDAARESASQAKKQKEAAKKAAAAKKAEAKKRARLTSDDFCLTQSWHGRCTITSVAMMLRRAVYLDGSKSWKEVTEASTAANGWVGGVGVKFTFKSAGHTVTKRALKTTGSSTERIEELKALLAEHPEGIAIYDPGVPHAILLSGYDEKTKSFTCADPAQGYAGKQVSVGETWNAAVRGNAKAALAGFSEYWVISA